MNPKVQAMRAGLARGAVEFRQVLTTPQDLWGYLIPAAIQLLVLIMMRDSTVDGTSFSAGTMAVPGVLGMNIAFTGLMSMAQVLTLEREDGTLLRAKATPNGMLGYLIGKVVSVSGMSLISLLIVLVPSMLLFDGLADRGLVSWLTLAWVLAVGLVATMPIGAVIGSLFSNPRTTGLLTLPLIGLVVISGVFFPINSLPVWLQWIAQGFPIYWLGLGMRSGLLPDGMSQVEIGESWRHLETLGVLGIWAALGLVVAPVVLRWMARRESGSSVAARREKAIQRVR